MTSPNTDIAHERVVDAPHVAMATSHENDFAQLMSLSKELVASGFLPRYISKPAQAVAIILAGRELGMGPMRSLRSLRMVEGNVTEDAASQLARFKSSGGRAQWTELTDKRAVLELTLSGDRTTSTFTIEDAQRAGLAGKDVWKKYPKAMLRSRAITQGLKDIGWDGGIGVYDPEELVGIIEAPTRSDRQLSAGARDPQPEGRQPDFEPALIVIDEETAHALDAKAVKQRLARALALPLYGRRDRFGGFGGMQLGDVPQKELAAALDAFHEALGTDALKASTREILVEQTEAIALVLDHGRSAANEEEDESDDDDDDDDEDEDGEAKELDFEKPRSPHVLPPTEDDPEGAQYAGDPYPTVAPTTILERVNALLETGGLGEGFVRQMRLMIDTGATDEELVLAEKDLRAMIATIPAPRKKGARRPPVGALPGGA